MRRLVVLEIEPMLRASRRHPCNKVPFPLDELAATGSKISHRRVLVL